jgi:hypothetical protein
MRRSVKCTVAAMFLSVIAGAGGSPASAEQETPVAFVEDVTGRVVAFSQGKPSLLGTLDTIDHRTQLDLPPSGELRVCHYHMGKVVTLKGPLRATVSRDGVTLANGKSVATAGPCAAPPPSTVQGGIVTRGVSDRRP